MGPTFSMKDPSMWAIESWSRTPTLRAVLRYQKFFSPRPPLSNAPKDHQPPTTNRQPLPTGQPPAATNRQLPQPPSAANHHQPPPTAINHYSPIPNRPPPAAKTWCAHGHFRETSVQEHFLSSVKDCSAHTAHGPGIGKKFFGLFSWGHGLPPFNMAVLFGVKDSYASGWPFASPLRTPLLRYCTLNGADDPI